MRISPSALVKAEFWSRPQKYKMMRGNLLIISQGQPTTGSPPNYIENTFRLSKVISLDLYKCILSGAMKFVSRVRSS